MYSLPASSVTVFRQYVILRFLLMLIVFIFAHDSLSFFKFNFCNLESVPKSLSSLIYNFFTPDP